MNRTATKAAARPELQRRGGHRIGGRLYLPTFAVMRTPYLPWDDLIAWGHGLEAPAGGPHPSADALQRDRRLLRDRLRAIVERPDVREAIHLASPDLESELPRWLADPDDPKLAAIETALVRYVQRMAGRCTPFGLFAGCSLVALDERTELGTGPRGAYRRRTRLDMNYLTNLVDTLARDPRLQDEWVFVPNNSLYDSGGRLRYVESRVDGRGRSHLLVSADRDEYLVTALAAAARGARPKDVARAVAMLDPEVGLQEAREFVGELIAGQVLVPDLGVSVTGPDSLASLLSRLADSPRSQLYTKVLSEARDLLHDCDRRGPGVDPAAYRRLAELLGELPVPVDTKRLVQVDLWKPAPAATFSPRLAREVLLGVEALYSLQRVRRKSAFDDFVRAFADRYGDRAVALSEVLDEESGIGFQRADSFTADGSPLLQGLPFARGAGDGGAGEGDAAWRPVHAHLLRLLTAAAASGEREITLAAADIERLAEPGKRPLPDAFSLLVTVAGDPDGKPGPATRVRLQAVVGPSGAKLLGRFCPLDDELTAQVRAHLAAEAAHRPDAVFAEIAHLPEGRVGNILFRPLLRDYEIPYLGQSGADDSRCLPVSDLLVSVDGGRVHLWSRRLGREVVPRLSTAHNYVTGAVGVYKFLCLLQAQEVTSVVAWDWGPLGGADFLPRVNCGSAVLSLATWNLRQRDIDAVTAGAGDGFPAVQELRLRLGLPRHLTVVEGDNTMPVDLDNALSVDVLRDLLRGRTAAQLTEQFPAPAEHPARGPEGSFAHELVIPFIRDAEEAPAPDPKRVVGGAHLPRTASDHAPGSEWLYAKIYCGPATADRLLGETVEPLARRLLADGACDRWFFLRFGDPDWHLRLRFRGDPRRLTAESLPALHQALAPLLADGSVSRLALDTYQQEVARYGGRAGLELAEAFFQADSQAVARIVSLAPGDAGTGARWLLGLYGVDRMLDDFGLGVAARLATMRPMQDTFRSEFGAHKSMKKKVGEKYRQHRGLVTELLACGSRLRPGESVDEVDSDLLAAGCRVLEARSTAWSDAARSLRDLAADGRLGQPLDQLGAAFAHMHLNRMLRSAARAHEMVIYEFLCREYSSRLARRSQRAVG